MHKQPIQGARFALMGKKDHEKHLATPCIDLT